MDPGELSEKKMKGNLRKLDRGVALILTMAITLIFVILVAAFYQTVIGRHRLVQKHSARTEGFYKAEAGVQDAIAKLRLGRQGVADPPAIVPAIGRPVGYCLDLDASPPVQVACGGGTDDVTVVVQPQDAAGLNQIQAITTF